MPVLHQMTSPDFVPTLNLGGRLTALSRPLIMGILNVTPDSFYADSRVHDEQQLVQRAAQMLADGADILDLGAYSSRSGAEDVSLTEEMARLRRALTTLRKAYPDALLSVDTFRADVAKMCVEEYGVQLINDISGGELDKDMFATVGRLGVPYILMHMQGNPQTMQLDPQYDDLMKSIFLYMVERLDRLSLLGVNDVILDPGFGFAKTLAHNYELLAHLDAFRQFRRPLLVGVSRKSMIYKLLGTTPDAALNGTTVLHTLALVKGAHILRVHDVREAYETVRIVEAMQQQLSD